MIKILRNITIICLLVTTVSAQDLAARFENYPVRNVGPVIQGARIVDIAVHPNNSHKFYIAFASGGLYKTINNGNTFQAIFDNQGSLTIGDIAISKSNPDTIYVGSGENNSSRSSYAGDGIYKSTDGGKNWNNIGLKNTQHIGRVVIHPENPDVVWVAAMGGLYSDNIERGVYKTTDGGQNWQKTLYIDDKTGAIDLIIDPSDADVLYASMWERKRAAWNFKGNGKGSALYKSTDGGVNWALCMNGIPDDEFTGRIGIDVSQKNPSILYAVLDYQKETRTEKKAEDQEGLKYNDFKKMSIKEFMGLSNEKLDDFLDSKGFPERYNAINVKKEVEQGIYEPNALANYFGDANEALFDTKIAGTVVYKSEDGGERWTRTHEYDLTGVYYTYGYYFGEIRIASDNTEEIYVLGVPLVKSDDGGKTFHRTDTIGGVHADHHSMWINPDNSDHIILGNDGGLYISYDRGASWDHKNNLSVGQFYTVNIDLEEPYNIYGGLQDNGTLVGSSKTVPAVRGEWERIFGGDGMYVSADPRNADLVYVGFQFGNYYRINRSTGKSDYITPSHNIGENKLRFNWRTPVLMSSHNADILYIGSQKLHRSLNKGASWEVISEDLTNGKRHGNVPYGTITEIAESPLKFGKLYIGTDDGNVWRYDIVSGWTSLNEGLPKNLWISSIHPSAHSENIVYASVTGYRNDDFSTYVYKSDNAGKSWISIAGNITDEPVNVIYEDLVHPEILYMGTDKGTYLSINTGTTWEKFNKIPNVASYDMVMHPREHDLIIGTHGRSVYVTNLTGIHKLLTSENLVAYKINDTRFNKRWGEQRHPYLPTNEASITLSYFVKELKPSKALTINIKNENKEIIWTHSEEISKAGYGSNEWNGRIDDKTDTSEQYIPQGKYTVEYAYGKDKVIENLEVK